MPYGTARTLQSCMWEDGRPRSLNDVARDHLDTAISRTENPAALRRLYHDRARIAAAAGQDPAAFLRESARAELLDWRQSFTGVVAVALTARPGACAACLAVSGRQLRLEDALAESLVPIVGCTTRMFEACSHPWCRCFYSRC